MRLPFLGSLNFENFKATFLRFPLSVLSGVAASTTLVWISATEWMGQEDVLPRFILGSFLGILLFTGLSLFAERHRLRSWVIQLLGIPVLAALVSPLDPDIMMFGMRGVLLFVASLALIFAGPYVRSKEDKGFWIFSVKVWTRAVLAIVTALIVVAGLALALTSIQHLFEVEIDYRLYEYIYEIFLIAVPNVVFLMGIPDDYKSLERQSSGVSFRGFGTYLFLPLISVYFLILAAYVVKIFATQVWPDGFVAMPIVIFSILFFGMYALVFPLLKEKEGKVLKAFSRVFLWSLPVFMLVYFVAFWQRIAQYGVTELRYLGVALGALILAWTLYFLFSKNARLKVIPLGLAGVAFLASFGPWGAFQVSEWNQLSRLETTLEANGLLKDGAIVPSTDEAVPFEARQQISGSLDYIVNNYGEAPVAAWFGGEDKVLNMGSYGLMGQLGLTYVGAYEMSPLDGGSNYYFSVDDSQARSVSGYQYSAHYYFYVASDMPEGQPSLDLSFLAAKSKEVSLHYNVETNAVEVSVTGGKTLSIALNDFMAKLEKSRAEQTPLTPAEFTVSGENGSLAAAISFNTLSYHLADDQRTDISVDATVLLKLK